MRRWQWDETLYAGSASHYSQGRMPYPSEVVTALRNELGLDGTGRLLDVGCGPGSLTLLLAAQFEASIGVDADPDMIAQAHRRAADAGCTTVRWHHMRAEKLSASLGTFRVATFAQSFHWMDRPRVALRVRDMLTNDGSWVHVYATTHRGEASDDPLPYPRPPWHDIEDLTATYLGPVPRAGQTTLPTGLPDGEEEVMRHAGFNGPTRITIAGGHVVERTIDDVVAAVFSLSSSAPHLFGGRLPIFEAQLRRLLTACSPQGHFNEQTGDVALVIWRP